MLKRYGLTNEMSKLKIANAWNAVVGDNVARRTAPHNFRRGVLIVRTPSAAWRNELTFLKAEILRKLRLELPGTRIDDIKVVCGELDSSPSGPEPPPWLKLESTQDDKDVAKDVSQPIKDDSLRATFERLVTLDRKARKSR
jgi:predicted nucleic acid-binding Zn ribbon protein